MMSVNEIDVIHIAFAINDFYVDHLGVEMLSILDNNRESSFSFYVLSNDLTQHSKNKLNLLLSTYSTSKIHYVHVDDKIFEGFPLRIKHITKETYYRYALPDILSELNKVLYLDADLIILGDLRPLWDTDIKNYFVAGSHKAYIAKQFPGYKESIGLHANSTYINGGVLLMNLNRIRKYDKTRELFDNTVKLKDIIKIQDQDVINITLKGGIKRVDKIYNYTTSDATEGTRRSKNVVVVHFNTRNKPWNNDFIQTKENKAFIQRYIKYTHQYATLLDALDTEAY